MFSSAKRVDQIIEKINLESELSSCENIIHNDKKICTICLKRVHKNQKAITEGYFGVCGIAVSGVISARYCGIKGKNWRYCGIEFLQRGMRYRYKSACTVHEILFF